MLKALEVLLPVFVTMGLGYAAAWHGRFDAEQVPTLNKVVLLYAAPMSISVGLLRLSRATLLDNVGLLLVLMVGLEWVDGVEIGRTQSLRYLEHQNQRNPDGREKPLRCEF